MSHRIRRINFRFGRRSKKRFRARDSVSQSAHIEVRAFTKAKLGEVESTNADSFAFDESSGVVAVADGVSRSYLPKLWSQRIVNALARNGIDISDEDVIQLREGLGTEETEFENESWFTSELRLKGSHSTMIASQLDVAGNQLVSRLVAVGDCNAFLIRNGIVTSSWPFETISEFPAQPFAISSTGETGLDQLVKHSWSTQAGDKIILTTDASARFIIGAISRNPTIDIGEILPFLSSDSTENEIFSEWADLCRLENYLEDDDLTIVEISILK